MSKKIGRNDPCPCGSGKKYKNCCLKDEKIIPFPGTFDANPSQNIQNTPPANEPDNIRTIPFGSQNPFGGGMPLDFPDEIPATPENIEMMQQFAAMMDEAGISSEEDLQEFLDEYLPMENQKIQDDFLGLTPHHMDSIINKSIAENAHIVTFNYRANAEVFEDVKITQQAYAFLAQLKEMQPLKGTAKGNLSRKFVQSLFQNEHYYVDYDWAKPNKEEDSYSINLMRILLNMAELIKFEGGKFSLTLKGEDILATHNTVDLYKTLFVTYAERFNWGYFDEIPDDIFVIIQDTFLFNLLILEEFSDDFVEEGEFARHYLQAFPMLSKHLSLSPYGPEMEVSHAFCMRFLDRFLYPFGLIDYKTERIHPEGMKMPRIIKYYKKTDLFENFIDWKI